MSARWGGDVLSAQGGPVLRLEPRTMGSGRLTLGTGWLTAIALDFLASVDDCVRERVGEGGRGRAGGMWYEPTAFACAPDSPALELDWL